MSCGGSMICAVRNRLEFVNLSLTNAAVCKKYLSGTMLGLIISLLNWWRKRMTIQ